ncbi:MAG: redoxin domain-containing protein [Gemmataceae bacterium]|nr:redoxin domain-containing protein [Gemmataceae bacterium]
MKRLMVLSLAGLVLVPAAWAGGDKGKKNGAAVQIEGKLTKDDPADKIRTGNPHKVHEYKLKAGSVFAIKLLSKDPKAFDIYLRLEDSAGKNLAEDDDGGGWPHAQIIFKAPKDDAYRIIATAYSGAGDYTLSIKDVAPKDLEGALGLDFAKSLRTQYEARYQGGDMEAGSLLDEAEGVLKQVAGNPSLAAGVKELQFALKNLTVGRSAMEIEGEDLDGKRFKLSDYRGKVVVLDFWGHW